MARVLIIDDGVVIRMYHREILESIGLEVFEAINGLDGLEQALQLLPDLLVVDINMPKMDGYTMLTELRTNSVLRSIPAIMLSTEQADSDIETAFSSGANTYLIKPVFPDILKSYARLMIGIAIS